MAEVYDLADVSFEQAQTQELPNWQQEQYADWIDEATPESRGVEVTVGEMPALDWLATLRTPRP